MLQPLQKRDEAYTFSQLFKAFDLSDRRNFKLVLLKGVVKSIFDKN